MKITDLFMNVRDLEIDWSRLSALTPSHPSIIDPEQIQSALQGTRLAATQSLTSRVAALVKESEWDSDDAFSMPIACVVATALTPLGESAARELLRIGTSSPLCEAVCWLIHNHGVLRSLFASGEAERKSRLIMLFRQRDKLLSCLLLLHKAECLEGIYGEQAQLTAERDANRMQAEIRSCINAHSRALRAIAKRGNPVGLFNELALQIEDGRFPLRIDKAKVPQGREFNVYLMVGISGSGKSYYLKHLAEMIEALEGRNPVVVSLDDIRRDYLHLPEDHLIGDDKQERRALQIMCDQFRSACREGVPIIVNNMNLRRKYRIGFRRLARGFNARFKCVFMDTDLATCVQRRAGKIDKSIIEDMAAKLEYPQPDEYYELETVFDGRSMFQAGTTYIEARANEARHPINPIIGGRIVSDTTYAVRLKSFIEGCQPACAMDEEEKEYLLRVANDLLRYQVNTAVDDDEVRYLKYIGQL